MKKLISCSILFLTFFIKQSHAEVYVGTDIVTSSEVMKEKEYRKGDFVLVRISEVSSSSYDMSKSGEKETEIGVKLAKWIRIKRKRDSATGAHVNLLKPSALDEPEIEFESDSRFENQASDKYKSALLEDVTAQIKDIRPNGNFYIEAHKELRENGNIRQVSFSGEVAKSDLDLGGAILSKKIYNLKIEINEKGERRNQTERNLLQKFLLWMWPF